MHRSRWFRVPVAMLLAATIWLPLLHRVFAADLDAARPASGVGPTADKLARAQLSSTRWAGAIT